MKSLPKQLYKYIQWENENSQNILMKNRIYFSSPMKFNDPFDCSLSIRYDEQTPEEILEDYKISLRRIRHELNPQEISDLAKTIQDDNPDLYPKIIKDILKKNLDTINKNAGIFSVSEICDNILMWSHYCDSHKGICIGFDAHELFNFLLKHFKANCLSIACAPINYRIKHPAIMPKWVDEKIGATIFTTKAKYWKYEKEWRFILWGLTDLEVLIPKGIINEVIIGCRMPEHQKDNIVRFLGAKKSKVELKQASPNPSEFRLDLRPIIY